MYKDNNIFHFFPSNYCYYYKISSTKRPQHEVEEELQMNFKFDG